MKTIPLTHNQIALVDDKDFENLNRFQWRAKKETGKNRWYACREIKTNNKVETVFMHRAIMDTPKEFFTDHRNHNGLDNQRHNLRICTNSQNQANRIYGRGVSKFKGVSFAKSIGKWTATIGFNRKATYLGCFDNEMEAAKAYDRKALELFGEFAGLNFPESKGDSMSMSNRWYPARIAIRLAMAEDGIYRTTAQYAKRRQRKTSPPYKKMNKTVVMYRPADLVQDARQCSLK